MSVFFLWLAACLVALLFGYLIYVLIRAEVF